MYFVLFFLFIIIVLLYLANVKPMKILFMFDSENMDICVSANWLRIIDLTVEKVKSCPFISVSVFNKKIYSKSTKKEKKSSIVLISSVKIKNTSVRLYYGLKQPHLSGLLFAALSFIQSINNINNFEQYPELIPAKEYLKIEITTDLNVYKTIENIVLLKLKIRKRRKNMDQNSLQSNLVENVDSLFRSLEDFTQREGIIGKPVSQGDKTFLPVVSITIGYGGGNATLKGQQSAGSSMSASTGTGALGLGARLSTDGVIVIDNQNVSLLPMNTTAATTLVDKIPQIIAGVSQNKQQSQPQGQPQGQAEQQPYQSSGYQM